MPLIVVLGISVLHICYLSRLKQFVDDRQTATAGHYGRSYRQRQDTIDLILEKAGSTPVRIVGPYSGWNLAYEYVLMFEQIDRSDVQQQPIDKQAFFWIDEQPPSENLNEKARRNQKERQLNTLAFRVSPDRSQLDHRRQLELPIGSDLPAAAQNQKSLSMRFDCSDTVFDTDLSLGFEVLNWK